MGTPSPTNREDCWMRSVDVGGGRGKIGRRTKLRGGLSDERADVDGLVAFKVFSIGLARHESASFRSAGTIAVPGRLASPLVILRFDRSEGLTGDLGGAAVTGSLVAATAAAAAVDTSLASISNAFCLARWRSASRASSSCCRRLRARSAADIISVRCRASKSGAGGFDGSEGMLAWMGNFVEAVLEETGLSSG